MKKIICMILLAASILSCSGCSAGSSVYKKYSYDFFGCFDTVIQFSGYFKSEADFNTMVRKGEERFKELHILYDIYNNYDGINNAKTINDKAGIEPVAVDKELIDIIEFSKDWYVKTCGAMNIALGPVLAIWHEYREAGIQEPENAQLPAVSDLEAASLKTDINKIIIDHEKGTVYLEETGMSIDLGAVAKGYATEIIANELTAEGYDSFVIMAGGNVKTVGSPKESDRTKWNIGIQNPDAYLIDGADKLLDIACVTDVSLVSSGDYERYYEVDGERYHHIIDPGTLFPAKNFRSVTIMTKDSGIADCLSTALFILSYEKGLELIEALGNADAFWVMNDGNIIATENMTAVLKNLGGATDK